ncbi:type I-F CRISPR-associated endoribonuclease Cas6/Csy4 [Endozoicomonas sp. ONNA2]|uniref:type I-F CRISPR-associated endoribonuclease Cas6/Csy4 n=1 Tax=Endozoicomonas sp. ONNA2 TaxID=2828741 RepID=UPI002147E65D|nr:type I-F CRISPR-associated endoribonuclease Cas6/Csy4 [Endozoicomonas sp. ONNA2]
MLTHYLEINCKTPPNETGWMLGKVFQQVHGFLSANEKDSIALALPNIKANHPGDSMRLFGSAEELEQLLLNTRLLQLEAGGAIEIIPVQPVPRHTSFAVYVRNRQSDKGSSAQLRKRMKRYLKHLANKGVEIDPVQVEERRKRLSSAYKDDRAFISLISQSTGQHFQLGIIQKIMPTANLGNFSSYGLANGQNPATVPLF